MAILPASLTLVTRHDGRSQAIAEARGARVGAFALIAFALIACALARKNSPAVTLVLATGAWGITSLCLWMRCYAGVIPRESFE